MTRVVRDSPISLGAHVLEGSCRFYDAPLAILVCLDDLFPEARLLCVGMALGYLVLAAEAKGLGTCPIGLITAYEEEIREQVNIPENKRIVLGLAVGFPDPEASLNHFRSSREDIKKMIRWITRTWVRQTGSTNRQSIQESLLVGLNFGEVVYLDPLIGFVQTPQLQVDGNPGTQGIQAFNLDLDPFLHLQIGVADQGIA